MATTYLRKSRVRMSLSYESYDVMRFVKCEWELKNEAINYLKLLAYLSIYVV